MRKLIVLTFVSLDGVMQAPGGKGEDPSGDFKYEGWVFPFWDDAASKEMEKQMGGQPVDLLLGRKTYDIFASYWPQRESPLNNGTKYVVSNGEVNKIWDKTIQISGDVAGEIKKIKTQDGPMLHVHGSSVLNQTLFKNDLVDEIWLKTFPVILGKGKKLFGEGMIPMGFKLKESMTTPSGVIFASYVRDGEVKTGSFS